MAREIDELVLRLTADSRQLLSEYRRIQQQNGQTTQALHSQWQRVGGTFSSIGRQITGFRAALGALGIGLSVGGLQKQVRDTLEFADSIDKVSTRLGISVEALQEFRFAAQQSGIDSRQLDIAVQRLGRRAAEAENGYGEAKDALAELNVELGSTSRTGGRIERVFEDAVRALGNVEDQATRLRLAFKLFDSEGVAVLQLVDNFDALRRQARELGVVLDRDTIRQAVKAKDELAAFASVIRVQLAPAFVDLAPILVNASKAFARVATAAGKFFGGFQDPDELGLKRLIEQMGVVGAEIVEIDKKIEQVNARRNRRGVFALETQRRELVERFEALQSEFRSRKAETSTTGRGGTDADAARDFERAQRDLNAVLEAAQDPTDKLLEKLSKLGEDYRKGYIQAEQFREAQEAIARQLESSGYDEGAAQAREFEAAQREVNRIIQAGQTPAERLIEQLEDLGAKFQAGTISAQQFADAQESVAKQLEKLGQDDSINKLKDGFSELGTLGQGVFDGLSGAFADFILGAELNLETLARAFARSFIQLGIQQSVLSLGTSLGFRAAGGPISAGQPYIVGERGPELIVPKSSGFVVPNRALTATSARSGAVVVNLSIRNQTENQITATQRTGPDGTREIELLVARVVAQDIARSGVTARAIDQRYSQRPRGA